MLAKLPYDARVDDAIDTGRPIVLTEPKADISKQFHAVVSYLAPEGEQSAATEPARATSRSNRRRFSLGRH
jgi:MinD-like ATPase involved in chromosome partitioning or flagellar assembly